MSTKENKKEEVYTQNNESPVLSPEYIRNSVLPEEIKEFMIKNLPWKNQSQPTLSKCCGAESRPSRNVDGSIAEYVCRGCGNPFISQQADTAHMSQKRLPVIEGMQNGVFNTPQQEKGKQGNCNHINGFYEKEGSKFCVNCYDYYPESLPKEDWMDNKNWHIIVGSNGMCECGSEFGTCGNRLKSFIQSQIEAERERAFKEGYEKGNHEALNYCEEIMIPAEKLNFREQGMAEERERIVKMIEDSLPQAWFPGGALELRKRILQELIVKINSNE